MIMAKSFCEVKQTLLGFMDIGAPLAFVQTRWGHPNAPPDEMLILYTFLKPICIYS